MAAFFGKMMSVNHYRKIETKYFRPKSYMETKFGGISDAIFVKMYDDGLFPCPITELSF